MNTLSRRLLSSNAAMYRGEAALLDPSSPIPAKFLPRVLYRRIEKHINALPPREGSSSSPRISLPNPFLLHRGPRRSDSEITGEARYRWRQPAISPRRQKQLLQFHSGTELPASTMNPQAGSRPVQWTDGTVVSWKGKVPERNVEEKKGVYAGRKRMFKGHRDERDRPQKDADRKARMDGMDKRISEWRQTRADEKIRSRPSLPF